MGHCRVNSMILLLIISGCVEYIVPPAQAGTIIIGRGRAEVWVGAGRSRGVDSIEFKVPGANVGDGNRVFGFENGNQATVLIDARARAPNFGGRTVFWTVDSSAPLQCSTPASCGATTIPLTRFGWEVTTGNEIADGVFSGAANQQLATFQTSRYIYTYQRFYFTNTAPYPAGDYRGRVIYTVSMP